jgi:uncharacterized repeat protein (TIGR01451 family)
VFRTKTNIDTEEIGMKSKFFAFILTVTLLIGFAACSGNAGSDNDAQADESSLISNDPTIIFGVRHIGETEYVGNIAAEPGEIVEAAVQVYNTTGQIADINGQINLDVDGVLSIVPDSATLTTAKGAASTGGDITEQHSWGVMDIYSENQNQGWGTLYFKVQVETADKLRPGVNSYHFGGQITAYDENGEIISDTERYDVSITVEGKVDGDVVVDTLVREEGADENTYAKNFDVNPGDTVQFQIEAVNAGETDIDNLVVRAVLLDTGLSYVSGTVEFYNSANMEWMPSSDDLFSDTGVNYGKYTPNGNVFVRFKAKVAERSELPNELTELRIAGQATDWDGKTGGTIESIATVTIGAASALAN